MTDSIAFELAVTKARISKGAIADALGISRMSLTRKINNVTEFKASEISLLKTILRLDDHERDKIFFANYVSVAASALQLKAREAQINAKKSRAKIEVEFWQERAETYKKTYEALEAQRLQMLGEYEQADAEVKEE